MLPNLKETPKTPKASQRRNNDEDFLKIPTPFNVKNRRNIVSKLEKESVALNALENKDSLLLLENHDHGSSFASSNNFKTSEKSEILNGAYFYPIEYSEQQTPRITSKIPVISSSSSNLTPLKVSEMASSIQHIRNNLDIVRIEDCLDEISDNNLDDVELKFESLFKTDSACPSKLPNVHENNDENNDQFQKLELKESLNTRIKDFIPSEMIELSDFSSVDLPNELIEFSKDLIAEKDKSENIETNEKKLAKIESSQENLLEKALPPQFLKPSDTINEFLSSKSTEMNNNSDQQISEEYDYLPLNLKKGSIDGRPHLEAPEDNRTTFNLLSSPSLIDNKQTFINGVHKSPHTKDTGALKTEIDSNEKTVLSLSNVDKQQNSVAELSYHTSPLAVADIMVSAVTNCPLSSYNQTEENKRESKNEVLDSVDISECFLATSNECRDEHKQSICKSPKVKDIILGLISDAITMENDQTAEFNFDVNSRPSLSTDKITNVNASDSNDCVDSLRPIFSLSTGYFERDEQKQKSISSLDNLLYSPTPRRSEFENIITSATKNSDNAQFSDRNEVLIGFRNDTNHTCHSMGNNIHDNIETNRLCKFDSISVSSGQKDFVSQEFIHNLIFSSIVDTEFMRKIQILDDKASEFIDAVLDSLSSSMRTINSTRNSLVIIRELILKQSKSLISKLPDILSAILHCQSHSQVISINSQTITEQLNELSNDFEGSLKVLETCFPNGVLFNAILISLDPWFVSPFYSFDMARKLLESGSFLPVKNDEHRFLRCLAKVRYKFMTGA